MINEKDMMHGRDYAGQDVSDWLMSEKLNGCRAYWDGQAMWSRGGREIRIPDTMRAALPACHLDGEMYAGRDGFEVARLAVQYGKFNDAVRFVVFDLPESDGAYCQRYEELERLLPADGVVSYANNIDCNDISAAIDLMVGIQAVGGEGVVLRDPYDLYTPGYPSCNRGVLKLKEMPS